MDILSINNDIKKEINVDAEGKAKFTIRGTARLLGVTHPVLLKHFQSGNLEPSELAKMLMDAGFEGGNLLEFSSDGIPDTAFSVIALYYAFYAGRNCIEEARLVLLSFSSVGVRAWAQNVTN